MILVTIAYVISVHFTPVLTFSCRSSSDELCLEPSSIPSPPAPKQLSVLQNNALLSGCARRLLPKDHLVSSSGLQVGCPRCPARSRAFPVPSCRWVRAAAGWWAVLVVFGVPAHTVSLSSGNHVVCTPNSSHVPKAFPSPTAPCFGTALGVQGAPGAAFPPARQCFPVRCSSPPVQQDPEAPFSPRLPF